MKATFLKTLILTVLVCASMQVQAKAETCEAYFGITASQKAAFIEDIIRFTTDDAFSDRGRLLPANEKALKKYLKFLDRTDIFEITPNRALMIIRKITAKQKPYWTQMKRVATGRYREAEMTLIDEGIGNELMLKGLLEGLEDLGVLKNRGMRDRFLVRIQQNMPMLRFLTDIGFLVGATKTFYLTGMAFPAWPHWQYIRLKSLPRNLLDRTLRNGLETTKPEILKFYGLQAHGQLFTDLMAQTMTRLFVYWIVASTIDDKLEEYGYGHTAAMSTVRDAIDERFNRSYLERDAFLAIKADLNEAGIPFDEKVIKAELHERSARELKLQAKP